MLIEIDDLNGSELLSQLHEQRVNARVVDSASSAWQPIETAPTTPNARVIIFAPSNLNEDGTVGEAFLGKDGFWYWAGCEEGYHDPIFEGNAPPTHWQPLPARP